MQLKQALLFSSQGKAHSIIAGYKVCVRTWQEEYQPVFMLAPGPFYHDAYELTISRMLNDEWQEPHVQHTGYGEQFLIWLTTEVLPFSSSTAMTFANWRPDEDVPQEETQLA